MDFSKTQFHEVEWASDMYRKLSGTMLLGKGEVVRIGREMIPVFEPEEGADFYLPPALRLNRLTSNVYIFKDTMSYLGLTIGKAQYAIPMEPNADVIAAIVTQRKVGLAYSLDDARSKSGRKKRMRVFAVPKQDARDIYAGLLLLMYKPKEEAETCE